MDRTVSLTKTSKIARNVFVISLVFFLISLVPISYKTGYSNGLSGAAGIADPNPTDPAEDSAFAGINYYITLITGIIGSVSLATSALANLQIAKTAKETERIKLETEKLRRETQLKEVEIYRLEEAVEKRKKKEKTVR